MYITNERELSQRLFDVFSDGRPRTRGEMIDDVCRGMPQACAMEGYGVMDTWIFVVPHVDALIENAKTTDGKPVSYDDGCHVYRYLPVVQ